MDGGCDIQRDTIAAAGAVVSAMRGYGTGLDIGVRGQAYIAVAGVVQGYWVDGIVGVVVGDEWCERNEGDLIATETRAADSTAEAVGWLGTVVTVKAGITVG